MDPSATLNLLATNVSAMGGESYEEMTEIGTGAYGTVYKARDLKNEGKFVAMKKIRIQLHTEEGMPASPIREIAMLKQMENFEHPNIVRFLDVCHGPISNNEMHLMLVFEHMEQDLSSYLEKCPSPGLGPERIKDLMHQMLSGVDFLHTNRIVHRDLKPQNILVSASGQIKIADFGLARVYAFQMALTSVVVTLWYRSPEVLLQDSYSTAVDMWSIGCIFAELFSRRPLFCGKSDIDQLCQIFEIMGLPEERDWPENVALPWTSFQPYSKQPLEKFLPELTPSAKDLVERLLMFNQNTRLNAQQALLHPYFVGEQQVVPVSDNQENGPLSVMVTEDSISLEADEDSLCLEDDQSSSECDEDDDNYYIYDDPLSEDEELNHNEQNDKCENLEENKENKGIESNS